MFDSLLQFVSEAPSYETKIHLFKRLHSIYIKRSLNRKLIQKQIEQTINNVYVRF